MPFDGGYMRKIAQEINQMAGARIDKINQPSKDILVISLRSAGESRKLLLSASAAAPKIHFTHEELENPKTAPMLCMLLRKKLGGAKLIEAQQYNMDRVLTVRFEAVNEFGDKVEIRLICEIMGRHSNIIIADENSKIIDAVKRVDFASSETRPILPGIIYEYPASRSKIDITKCGKKELLEMIMSKTEMPLSKAIQDCADGFSPTICREIVCFSCGNEDPAVCELDEKKTERLEFYLGAVETALSVSGGRPCVVRDETGKQVDFSYIELSQYPDNWSKTVFDTCSQAVDDFYHGRDNAEEMKKRAAQILKTVTNIQQRLIRKLAAQGEELERTSDRQKYKEWGDLVSANIYRIKQGDSSLVTENLFSEDMETIEIPLDIRLSPQRNTQKYYNEYRKLTTAEKKLTELITQGSEELEYIESVVSQLKRVSSGEDLEGIKQELLDQRIIRPDKGQKSKPVRLAPLTYTSSDGFKILCGRNNLQNDQLTLKEANNHDMWLHTQKIHGSHTIIIAEKEREFTPTAIEEAAVIAAVNSDAGESTKVAVDFTPVKFVKKPAGSRPGLVIYETYQTIMVYADKNRADSLLDRKKK